MDNFFFVGLARKLVGAVYVSTGAINVGLWDYWSNGALFWDGTFLNRSIRLDKHLTHIRELSPEESVNHVMSEVKLKLCPAMTMGETIAIIGALVSPIVPIAKVALDRVSKSEKKAESPPDLSFACFHVGLDDGRQFVAVALRSVFDEIRQLPQRA